MTSKSLLLFVLLIPLSLFAQEDAAPMFVTWGLGNSSCGRYLEDREDAKILETSHDELFTQWSLGFITGLNVE